MSDWQVTITNMLIKAGAVGCRQADLVNRAKGAGDGEVVAFLRVLASQKKVDYYVLPGDVKQWRATTEIQKLE